MKTTKVKISELKAGPIRQEILPEGFIERVIKYKEILKGVENMSLEETVSNFQRDWNPERELLIWENIAYIYKSKVGNNTELTITEKRKVLSEILISTMM